MPTVLISAEPIVQKPARCPELFREAGFEIRYPQNNGLARSLWSEEQTIEELRGCAGVIAGGEIYSSRVLSTLPDLRILLLLQHSESLSPSPQQPIMRRSQNTHWLCYSPLPDPSSKATSRYVQDNGRERCCNPCAGRHWGFWDSVESGAAWHFAPSHWA